MGLLLQHIFRKSTKIRDNHRKTVWKVYFKQAKNPLEGQL